MPIIKEDQVIVLLSNGSINKVAKNINPISLLISDNLSSLAEDNVI